MGKTKNPSDRSAKGRNDRCVQGTNDSSVVSKCSMSSSGYFDDVFLQHFVAKSTRRAPLIHRGYFVRAEAVQRAFDAFLKLKSGDLGKEDEVETMDDKETSGEMTESQNVSSAPPVFQRRQIISLGAGFDASYFRLRSKGQLSDNDVYVEIDFLPLCQRKAALIRNSKALCDVMGWEVDERVDESVDKDNGGNDALDANADKGQETKTRAPTSTRAPEIVIDTPTYKLLGVDLSNIPLLDACLSR